MLTPVPYDKFRTGLGYHDVYMMLWDRPHKHRNTVLGFWRQMKQEMYAEYLRRFAAAAEASPVDAKPTSCAPTALELVPPSTDPPAEKPPSQVKPGRIPVKKEIVHRGRRFAVTYWIKAPPLAA